MTGWMFVVSSMLLVVLGSMLGFVIGLMVGLFIPTAEERKERLMPEPHSPQKPPPTDPLQEARRLSEWTVSALEYYKHDPSYCFTAGEARELADEVLALAQRVEDAERERDELVEAVLTEHHIATAGPRKGRMVHSDCALCDWLDSHPVRQALRQEEE